MRAYWHLPEALQVSAYTAGGEYAWRQDDAVRVIQCLSDGGYAVIGVEVWLATEPGPTVAAPGIYIWEGRPHGLTEPWFEFVRCVNTEAARYVETFAWNPSDVEHAARLPYFNLTVVDEPRS